MRSIYSKYSEEELALCGEPFINEQQMIVSNLPNEPKYNYVYKIVDKITKRYYYGVHSTNNLFDNYMGSGVELNNQYKIRGKEDFFKFYLYSFNTREQAFQKEKEIVTYDIVNDGMSYNNRIGGSAYDKYNNVVVYDFSGKPISISKDNENYKNGVYKSVWCGTVAAIDENGKNVQITQEEFYNGNYKGVQSGKVTVKDSDGNTFSVDIDDERYLNGELLATTKNKVPVYDENNKIIMVSKDDERYLNGTYKFVFCNTVVVRDENGKCFRVSTTDERYLNGSLKNALIGFKQSEKAKAYSSYKASITNIENDYMYIENGEYWKLYIKMTDFNIKKYIIVNGWEIIDNEFNHTHKVIMHNSKTREEQYVCALQVKKYYLDGWRIGNIKYINHQINEKMHYINYYMNKNGIQKAVKTNDVEKMLNDGWRLGRTPIETHKTIHMHNSQKQDRNARSYEECISLMYKGWFLGHSNKNGDNMIPIYNAQNDIYKFIRYEELDEYTKNGWIIKI